MTTTVSAKAADVRRDWLLIDATDLVLGRMAAHIAHRLRGKHKPIYTPHVDTGDYIVVVNVDKLKVTGNKASQKNYYRHSGRPGNLHVTRLDKQLAERPERVLEAAVKGMLPKNKLGRAMFKKLKIYSGAEHPHEAQQPQTLKLN